MTCEQDREELTVYALAALTPQETDRVDRHLRECSECAAALEDLRGFLTMVEQVPAREVTGDWEHRLPAAREAAVRAVLAEAAPEPPALPPADQPVTVAEGIPATAEAVAATDDAAVAEADTVTAVTGAPPLPGPRSAVSGPSVQMSPPRRGGRVSWALAAAVAGLVLGFGGGALLPDDGPSGTTTAASARPTGPAVVRARSAAGLVGAVEPRATGWGTELVLELSGVDGPQRCALVAVSRNGDRETAVTWQVPDGGYGLPGSRKERLLAVGGVGMSPDQITGYEIRTTDGQQLLTIPAPHASG
ncbi:MULTISPECIES: anti-sigma factor family protein [unclassified Streptomyces]|uniref:anti-sigma factor family protein n=1 Tax=unclassified Streptomyces TaxID=2593676 RepID=UPI00381AEA31